MVYTLLLTPEMNWKQRYSMKNSVFWDIMLYSLEESTDVSKGSLFFVCPLLVSCLVHFLAEIMKPTSSSEASVDFQRTTRRHISEESSLHIHRWDNSCHLRLLLTMQNINTKLLNAHNRCNRLHRVFCEMLSDAWFQHFWSGSWNYVQKFLELLTFHLHRRLSAGTGEGRRATE
jgi:hypothetical protein